MDAGLAENLQMLGLHVGVLTGMVGAQSTESPGPCWSEETKAPTGLLWVERKPEFCPRGLWRRGLLVERQIRGGQSGSLSPVGLVSFRDEGVRTWSGGLPVKMRQRLG